MAAWARAAAAAIALLGCDEYRGPEPSAPPLPAPGFHLDDQPATLQGAPASTRAGARAPARADWPCAVELAGNSGTYRLAARATFDYGDRTTCWMPDAVIAMGVFGCPDAIVDATLSTRHLTYDPTGHMTSLEGAATSTFQWAQDRLTGFDASQAGATEHTHYVDDGTAVVAIDDRGRYEEAFTLDDQGRVTAYNAYEDGLIAAQATITWDGKRPQVVSVDTPEGLVTRTFVYDCH